MKKFLNVVACVALLSSFSHNVFAVCTDGASPDVDWSKCDKSSTPSNPQDYTNLDLHNAHLEGTDFSYSNLSNTYLNAYGDANTKFVGAIMNTASFQHGGNWDAEFNGTNFKMASLINANLFGAHIRNANFTGANLTGAKLNSDGDRADFTDAIMTGANFDEGMTGHSNFKSAKFIRADLTGARFTNDNFSMADFTNANLTNANLKGMNATGVTWTEAILNNATWIDGTTCKVPSIGRCNK